MGFANLQYFFRLDFKYDEIVYLKLIAVDKEQILLPQRYTTCHNTLYTLHACNMSNSNNQ